MVERRSIRGGESGNVIVLTMRLTDDGQAVFHHTEYSVPAPGQAGLFRVRFDPDRTPAGYTEVADGIAYLYNGNVGLQTGFDGDLGEGTFAQGNDAYATSYTIDPAGLVILLILPRGSTLADFHPTPVAAKASRGGQIGVAWAAYKVHPDPAVVEKIQLWWKLRELAKPYTGVPSAVQAIRKEMSRRTLAAAKAARREDLVDAKQALELSLPIIPGILSYKVEVSPSVRRMYNWIRRRPA
jgi:hypothetical protein